MNFTWADFKRLVEDRGVTDGDQINFIDVTAIDLPRQNPSDHLAVVRGADGSVEIVSL